MENGEISGDSFDRRVFRITTTPRSIFNQIANSSGLLEIREKPNFVR